MEAASSFFVVVPKSKCQPVRDLLRQQRVLDKGRQSWSGSEESVGIPVRWEQSRTDIFLGLMMEKVGLTSNEVGVIARPNHDKERQSGSSLMSKLCEEVMTKHNLWSEPLLEEVPSHWEKHNDLALFPEIFFKSESWIDSRVTGELWTGVCSILKVGRLAKKSPIANNDFRSPKVSIFYSEAGLDNTWVSRKENGIIYHWDIARSMFSVGNITEKMRIARMDCRDQVVVDLFAGIGYFTLPYLVHAGAAHVHACEWNPAAVEALRKNVKENHVEDRCTIYQGDNRVVCPRGIADRVNLGLLPTAEMSYKTACLALNTITGGTLHVHGNARTEKDPETNLTSDSNISESYQPPGNPSWRKWSLKTAKAFTEIFREIGNENPSLKSEWKLELIYLEHVKSFAPHVDHLVLDIKCSPCVNL